MSILSIPKRQIAFLSQRLELLLHQRPDLWSLEINDQNKCLAWLLIEDSSHGGSGLSIAVHEVQKLQNWIKIEASQRSVGYYLSTSVRNIQVVVDVPHICFNADAAAGQCRVQRPLACIVVMAVTLYRQYAFHELRGIFWVMGRDY